MLLCSPSRTKLVAIAKLLQANQLTLEEHSESTRRDDSGLKEKWQSEVRFARME